MKLCDTTLKKLREIINEESKYRSGPELIDFFNGLGFEDAYGKGFPSRWIYTDSKLEQINGTPEIDKCIKKIFAPNLYIGNYEFLDELIKDFNEYISYDGWMINRNGKEISFSRTHEIYEKEKPIATNPKEFLSINFGEINLSKLQIENEILIILEQRIKELKIIVAQDAPLSSIIMIGSILEGLLLAIATAYPKMYNTSLAAPKDKSGNVKKFNNWTLNEFINVTYNLGVFQADVHKFTSSLRDFRNYIHPYQQLLSDFKPTQDTVQICYQVLRAAANQLASSSLLNHF